MAALSIAGAGVRAADAPQVFFSVVAANGAPIVGLKPSQLSMLVNGMPCAQVRIEPIDWPMKLQILVDNGPSMAAALPALKAGLRDFLAEIPEGVQISLVTYSPDPAVVVEPTTNPDKVKQGVDVMASTLVGSKFIDAAGQAATRIVRSKGDFFHAMMVVTANGPEGTRGNLVSKTKRLLEDLSGQPVVAHVLMLSLSEQQSFDGVAGAAQTQAGMLLAKQTRGLYRSVTSVSQLPVTMKEFGTKIARSNHLQTHQYRAFCDSSKPKSAPRLSLSVSVGIPVELFVSPDGVIP